ncbi:MAG: NTP transferase domain-containing protein [Proteobacteria bacterium]|jgi:1L-myo-inositol 1-phosphate cytidylyltransferase|nr:NTP transferase domain-containing protein [Pseudomonadota bacterium]
MKCLIIAAGLGRRLRPKAEIKPLALVGGIPLIDRVILTARDAGCDEFYIVTGYRGRRLREHLTALSGHTGIKINTLVNPGWEKPNGWSVLCAKNMLKEPFILSMCDHLYPASLMRDLISAAKELESGLMLATDSQIDNPDIDLDDVTRVYQADGQIKKIGKVLKEYNAFDTGVFACTPDLFDAIETSIEEHEDGTLSGGVRVLAERGLAQVHEIGGKFWLDIDDPDDHEIAEAQLKRLD